MACDMNRLLSSLTQALQKAGIDLSHAKLSVQIDLGKRANPSNKVLIFEMLHVQCDSNYV